MTKRPALGAPLWRDECRLPARNGVSRRYWINYFSQESGWTEGPYASRREAREAAMALIEKIRRGEL